MKLQMKLYNAITNISVTIVAFFISLENKTLHSVFFFFFFHQ